MSDKDNAPKSKPPASDSHQPQTTSVRNSVTRNSSKGGGSNGKSK
ncbi:hypothetical protein [uncultured Paraglaciecola sp.]|nr:hypothetical protein [uncultured Paraglaciecola sp.]